MSRCLIISPACHARNNFEIMPVVANRTVFPPEGGHMAAPLLPLPSTDPPSSFPRERLTSQNLITLLTCPICSVAGREGFNYICMSYAGEPSFPTPQDSQHCREGGEAWAEWTTLERNGWAPRSNTGPLAGAFVTRSLLIPCCKTWELYILAVGWDYWLINYY